MRFLVDENLPPKLAEFIRQSGHTSYHINESIHTKPVSDQAIRKLALYKDWVIISRDDDFVKSYVARKVPEKLIYVFGLSNRKEILASFEKYWSAILKLITQNELIELNSQGIKVHF